MPTLTAPVVTTPPTETTTATTAPTTTSGGGGGGGGGGDSGVVTGSIQSTVYSISGSTITGLDPDKKLNTVSTLSSKVSVPTGATLTIISPSGKTLSSSAQIGTGSKINVVSGSQTLASYTAIVYGDVNGDGSINITDVATLFKYVRNKQTLGAPSQVAADTDRNTKVNITDVATAFSHVRNKLTINQ
ncbi:MAG: hypothetical protein EOM08_16025 [Clostridia bacterium]|nr:hypothetical protein [Clostridia bacterium]